MLIFNFSINYSFTETRFFCLTHTQINLYFGRFNMKLKTNKGKYMKYNVHEIKLKSMY